ncbi:trichohyalin-like [Penaeus japonicus]|uniref:trichohyalin-like n=1 Tax=Penaeus japonicus TaxID=27405 RepID=UPI001C7110C2|nr:trichohyalin-like [Penaeus japonicus]
MRPDWSVCRRQLRPMSCPDVGAWIGQSVVVSPGTMRNYLDETRELGLRGMQVLHYIEQQEKIRREKEERAYQEQEKQRQEAEKRRQEAEKQRQEARKQRKLAERELKKRQLQREQEERALEERLRQKEDAQKAQQGAVGTALVLGLTAGRRSDFREGRRSEELPATNYHPAEIVRSREDLSQQWIRRPNGQEQRVHPGSDRRAKRPRSKEQRPRSIRPRMEVSAGKARAQEAQSAEARAPVKAWAPEEPPAEAKMHQRSSQQKRVHRRSR